MTREDLIELATAFRDATAEEIAGAQKHEEFHRVTRRAQQRLDQLFSAMVEEGGVPIACRAGCSFCCHFKVESRAPDVFALAAWVEANFTAPERAALLERLRAHAAKLEELSTEQQLRTNLACPLLREGRCSAYAARPAACRIAHSMNVQPCEYAYEHPEEIDAPSGADVEMRLALRVAHDGVAWAFRDAGFDDRPYRLSAALAEALTDPNAAARWLARERAFSPGAASLGEGAGESRAAGHATESQRGEEK
jgi:Fe-S-cluster containining protein